MAKTNCVILGGGGGDQIANKLSVYNIKNDSEKYQKIFEISTGE